MKKICKLLIICLVLILSSCDTDDDNPPFEQEDESFVEFTSDSVSVYLYESVTLPLNTNIEMSNFSYSSTNETVAIVVDNNIVPLSGGSTTITASTSNKSDSIVVNVVDDENVPFLDIDKDTLSLFEGNEYDIDANILLRNKRIEGSYHFKTSDSSVATVDEKGHVTAIKSGVAYINVEASYDGYSSSQLDSLSRTIIVTVNPIVVMDISCDSLIINTRTEVINSVEYNNEVNLFGTLLTSSGVKDIYETSCEWISTDPSIAKVVGNKIIGYKVGKVDIHAQIEINNEVYTSNYLSISVENPTIDIKDKIIDVDLSNDKFNFAIDYMLGNDNEIIKIYDQENPYINIYEDNKLVNYDELGPRKWIVESESNNYKLDVVICSKIITTAEELLSLHTYGRNVVRGTSGIISYEGYFILGSNIDMKGTRFRTFCGIPTGATSYAYGGFIGVFDGRGYTISNATVTASNGGLFPTFNKNSIIKNVAFVRANVTGKSGLISSNFGGKIENVYIEGQLNCSRASAEDPSSLVASKIYDGAKISNCIIKLTNPGKNYNYSSVIGMLVTAKEDALENVYVLGTETNIISTSVGNRYSVLSEENNGQFKNYQDLLLCDLSSFNNFWVFGDSSISFSNSVSE